MRISQADTAIQSFHAHAHKSSAQRQRILNFFRCHGGNWSIGELAHALDLEKSTVSARINELLYEHKELIEFRKRKDRYSGVMVRPVGLPPEQFDLFGGVQ